MLEWQTRGVFSIELLDSRPGYIAFKSDGNLFKDEAGAHQWQRVPPTEKKGRIQTSLITVAVLEQPTSVDIPEPEDKDLEWSMCRGSGPGGQHRNKTESAVMLKHKPSGIMVRCETERSQHYNRKMAMEVLLAKLWENKQNNVDNQRASDRSNQIGSGRRGKKRRSVREKDGIVIDSITNKQWRLKDYLKGDW